MKKLCVWALAAMMTVGATGAMADHLDDIKAKGKLVVGSEVSFAPFEFYFVGEDGKEYEAGFEMELARQIAADIGVELEVSDQQFNGLIPALQNGDVGIFCVDGDLFCKQYYKDPAGVVYLFSLNRKRADADVILPPSGSRGLVCFGRVILHPLPLPGRD